MEKNTKRSKKVWKWWLHDDEEFWQAVHLPVPINLTGRELLLVVPTRRGEWQKYILSPNDPDKIVPSRESGEWYYITSLQFQKRPRYWAQICNYQVIKDNDGLIILKIPERIKARIERDDLDFDPAEKLDMVRRYKEPADPAPIQEHQSLVHEDWISDD